MNDWGWDERELIRRCKDGSEAAYAELVRQHRPRLFTLAYRLTNDRESAEDVVQETFLAAFRAIERFEPRPSVAAWLNRIAVRLAGKVAAKRRARPLGSFSVDSAEAATRFDEPIDLSQDPHVAAEMQELGRALSAAITDLPFKMRTAVVLRHVLGLDYAEAAKVMDVPLNTYKSYVLRGVRQLRDSLASTLELTRPVEPDAGRLIRQRGTGPIATDVVAAASGNGSGRDRTVFDLPAAGAILPNEELLHH